MQMCWLPRWFGDGTASYAARLGGRERGVAGDAGCKPVGVGCKRHLRAEPMLPAVLQRASERQVSVLPW